MNRWRRVLCTAVVLGVTLATELSVGLEAQKGGQSQAAGVAAPKGARGPQAGTAAAEPAPAPTLYDWLYTTEMSADVRSQLLVRYMELTNLLGRTSSPQPDLGGGRSKGSQATMSSPVSTQGKTTGAQTTAQSERVNALKVQIRTIIDANGLAIPAARAGALPARVTPAGTSVEAGKSPAAGKGTAAPNQPTAPGKSGTGTAAPSATPAGGAGSLNLDPSATSRNSSGKSGESGGGEKKEGEKNAPTSRGGKGS